VRANPNPSDVGHLVSPVGGGVGREGASIERVEHLFAWDRLCGLRADHDWLHRQCIMQLKGLSCRYGSVTPTSETANEGIFVLGARVQSGEKGVFGQILCA
jgi:hypothetical protein